MLQEEFMDEFYENLPFDPQQFARSCAEMLVAAQSLHEPVPSQASRQQQLQSLFQEMDLDNSGNIDAAELSEVAQMRRALHQKSGDKAWTAALNNRLMEVIDSDGDGQINKFEFIDHYLRLFEAQDDDHFNTWAEQFQHVVQELRTRSASAAVSSPDMMSPSEVFEEFSQLKSEEGTPRSSMTGEGDPSLLLAWLRISKLASYAPSQLCIHSQRDLARPFVCVLERTVLQALPQCRAAREYRLVLVPDVPNEFTPIDSTVLRALSNQKVPLNTVCHGTARFSTLLAVSIIVHPLATLPNSSSDVHHAAGDQLWGDLDDKAASQDGTPGGVEPNWPEGNQPGSPGNKVLTPLLTICFHLESRSSPAPAPAPAPSCLNWLNSLVVAVLAIVAVLLLLTASQILGKQLLSSSCVRSLRLAFPCRLVLRLPSNHRQ